MNKFVKILIIINGILFPILIGIALFDEIKSIFSNDTYIEDGIIVGEDLEKAKSDSLAYQGLHYDNPEKLYNSTNYYLPISVMTYEDAKELKDAKASANDFNYSFPHTMNVVFLDKNYDVITTLVNRKASISEIKTLEPKYYRSKIDTTIKNIAYLIGYEDTNKDGLLNRSDHHDLYISDLDGQNLVQVTEKINVLSFEFKNSNREIIIRYTELNDQKKEHRTIKLGAFNIQKSEYRDLTSLNNTLKKIENSLIK